MLKVSDLHDQKPINRHPKDLDKFGCVNFETITGNTYQRNTESFKWLLKLQFYRGNQDIIQSSKCLTARLMFFQIWKNIS
jgi:hypothetical protein